MLSTAVRAGGTSFNYIVDIVVVGVCVAEKTGKSQTTRSIMDILAGGARRAAARRKAARDAAQAVPVSYLRSEASPSTPSATVFIQSIAGRGRCVMAAVALPEGTIVDALSAGGPYAACPLHARQTSTCESCLGSTRSAGSTQLHACSSQAPRGCSTLYCCEACRARDHETHGYEATLQHEPGSPRHASRAGGASDHGSTTRGLAAAG